MALSFYSTQTLIRAVDQMVKPKNFLRDRYFPFNPASDLFSTEQVLMEIKDGNKKLAPFVTPLKGGVLMKDAAVRMEAFTPPTIAPSKLLTIDKLRSRGFGEALQAELTPEQRAQQKTLQDIADLDIAISRREEKVAADILFTNKCVMKHITDDPAKTEDVELDFSNDGDNGAVYIPAAKWNSTTKFAVIESDINTMIRMLTSRGLPADDIILGTEVAIILKNNEDFCKKLDTKNLDVGALDAVTDINGASLLGHLTILGHRLNVFIYDEQYEDDTTGELKPFVPEKSICITAPAVGHTCYGSTILIPEGEENPVNFTGARVPQYLVNRRNGTREVIVYSHPLLLPWNVNPWVTAEVIATE